MTKKESEVRDIITDAVCSGIVFGMNRINDKELKTNKEYLVKRMLKVMRDD